MWTLCAKTVEIPKRSAIICRSLCTYKKRSSNKILLDKSKHQCNPQMKSYEGPGPTKVKLLIFLILSQCVWLYFYVFTIPTWYVPRDPVMVRLGTPAALNSWIWVHFQKALVTCVKFFFYFRSIIFIGQKVALLKKENNFKKLRNAFFEPQFLTSLIR